LADESDVTEIKKWHVEERGFEDIGYHFVILKNGQIQHGRDSSKVGAHALGKNHDSIGICLEGNLHNYEPTKSQLDASARLYHDICRYYSKSLKVEFHRNKRLPNACPGKKLDREDFLEIVYRANPFI